MTWAAMYMLDPVQDAAADAAFLAWLGYYVDCERYDRRVCTGGYGPRGGIMPASGWEHAAVTAHARERHQRLRHELGMSGASLSACEAAKNAASRLRFEDAERELVRLTGGAT